MEVDGHASADDEGTGMFAATDIPSNADSDDDVVLPKRLIRNVVVSDDEEPGTTTPPNTISVVDGAAPQDADYPCECPPLHLLYRCFVIVLH